MFSLWFEVFNLKLINWYEALHWRCSEQVWVLTHLMNIWRSHGLFYLENRSLDLVRHFPVMLWDIEYRFTMNSYSSMSTLRYICTFLPELLPFVFVYSFPDFFRQASSYSIQNCFIIKRYISSSSLNMLVNV